MSSESCHVLGCFGTLNVAGVQFVYQVKKYDWNMECRFCARKEQLHFRLTLLPNRPLPIHRPHPNKLFRRAWRLLEKTLLGWLVRKASLYASQVRWWRLIEVGMPGCQNPASDGGGRNDIKAVSTRRHIICLEPSRKSAPLAPRCSYTGIQRTASWVPEGTAARSVALLEPRGCWHPGGWPLDPRTNGRQIFDQRTRYETKSIEF